MLHRGNPRTNSSNPDRLHAACSVLLPDNRPFPSEWRVYAQFTHSRPILVLLHISVFIVAFPSATEGVFISELAPRRSLSGVC